MSYYNRKSLKSSSRCYKTRFMQPFNPNRREKENPNSLPLNMIVSNTVRRKNKFDRTKSDLNISNTSSADENCLNGFSKMDATFSNIGLDFDSNSGCESPSEDSDENVTFPINEISPCYVKKISDNSSFAENVRNNTILTDFPHICNPIHKNNYRRIQPFMQVFSPKNSSASNCSSKFLSPVVKRNNIKNHPYFLNFNYADKLQYFPSLCTNDDNVMYLFDQPPSLNKEIYDLSDENKENSSPNVSSLETPKTSDDEIIKPILNFTKNQFHNAFIDKNIIQTTSYEISVDISNVN